MIATSMLLITTEMLALVAEIDEFKGAWRALGRLTPERLSALRRVATIESIGSSTRMEGSKLSDREVERLLATSDVRSLVTRDEEEVAGCADVLELVFRSWETIAIKENHLKQSHRDLLKHSKKDAWHRGAYKTSPNSVMAFDEEGRQTGIPFATASPFETPRLMAELIDWLTHVRAAGSLHPLLIIGIFIVVLLEIHPFQDGNGRLSRILTTLLLLQAGYAYVPYGSLESAIEPNKQDYYDALRRTQITIRTAKPDWQPWLLFFLRSLQQQVRQLARRVERETLMQSALPELSARILDTVRDHGRISVGDMVRLTGASRNTLKEHFRRLVEKDHLVRRGGGRGVWYSLK